MLIYRMPNTITFRWREKLCFSWRQHHGTLVCKKSTPRLHNEIIPRSTNPSRSALFLGCVIDVIRRSALSVEEPGRENQVNTESFGEESLLYQD